MSHVDKKQRVSEYLKYRFLDQRGNKRGEVRAGYDVNIAPAGRQNLTIDRTTPLRADFKEVRLGTGDELVFEWKRRRWYLQDRWRKEKKFVLRSFSHRAYNDKGFDGRVFPSGRMAAEGKRYYRVAREKIPAGFGEDIVEREIEFYTLLPGFVVEGGKRRKPKFFDLGDAGITNSGVSGTIEVGEYVQLRGVAIDNKGFKLLVAPVCKTTSSRRRLRARLRFVVGREAMKGPDEAVVEQAVRTWLEPVSIARVSATCGPKSGTPVTTWDVDTTPDDVEAVLGPAEARAATQNGEVLVFGRLKVTFAGGRLVGVKKRSAR